MILVDTSCWIDYFHPKGLAHVRVALNAEIEEDRVATCGPVICEVLRGARESDEKKLSLVFSGLHYLTQTDRDWREVRGLQNKLKQQGFQPPLVDLLIAVIAHRHQAQFFHLGDRHFEVIRKVLPLQTIDLKSRGK
ncbi:MAG TPA: PIN domain-containing protein [Acidobacteriota bacterium]|nr:PIN domain-containing protein [Acidobacteriota bacterium]